MSTRNVGAWVVKLVLASAMVGCDGTDGRGTLPLEIEQRAGAVTASSPTAAAAPRFVPKLPPQIAEGAGIVKNGRLALVLGKAFFWDQQVGSDGQACASCHFHAGADTRTTNDLNPGFRDITVSSGGDVAFGSDRSDTGEIAPGQMPSGAMAGPNYTLVAADFPLHQLVDETDRDSAVRTDTDDFIGSVGAFDRVFSKIERDGDERCRDLDASIFHLGHRATRQVEPRHTPTTINAVFNNRQFWDGRANNLFNGVGVFGMRDVQGDPNRRLVVLDDWGRPDLGYLQLEDASLASQAVAPPLDDIEMTCSGRTFADIGRKLLAVVPLGLQRIDPADSALGPYAQRHGRGLRSPYGYEWLIQHAFEPRYWAGSGRFRIAGGVLERAGKDGYTQMEINMSMFWGISIMLYEATLISDQSEFDDLVAAGRLTVPPGPPGCNATGAVDPLLARGCAIFFRAPFGPPPPDGIRGAGCAFCHAGTDTFSENAVQAGRPFAAFLQVTDVNGVVGTRDLGFANIGTRPSFVDRFLGGVDPYGNPLALGREYRQFFETGDASRIVDPFLQRAIASGALVGGGLFDPQAKLESDGATKIPTVRNVALNPPYFSYGGYASLRQVMKFYNRGGNRRAITPQNRLREAHGSGCLSGDDTGSGPDGNHAYPVDADDCNTNTTGLMTPLGLRDCDANGQATCDVAQDDLSAVVRFMESLSDPRVQCDRAPFDHPQLFVTNGHVPFDRNRDGEADDRVFALPAVGAQGYGSRSGLCIPNAGDLFAPGMQARAGGPPAP